jgi:hypothetical protein
MTDSGAFTFFAKPTLRCTHRKNTGNPILKSMLFLRDNAHQIYCAANMDIDIFVGQENCRSLEQKYFEPLKVLFR